MLVFALLVFSAQPTTDTSYKAARQALLDEGKPMLILICADWCPACVAMKNGPLARLEKSGKLKGVSYVVIDSDRNMKLAEKLRRGALIPQLILYKRNTVFAKTAQDTEYQKLSFTRRNLIGGQSESAILDLLR